MPETDIYKEREPVSRSSGGIPHTRRSHQTSGRRKFDEQNRQRHSRNSGLRRLRHLLRKPENEKRILRGLLIVVVVLLTVVAIREFWYLEVSARKQTQQNEVSTPLPD